MKNIFIEGMQGCGKTTLLRNLSQSLEGYHAYWEGDISPVELAWCSYMTQEEYQKVIDKYAPLREEIVKNTKEEEGYRIVSYTRILAENRSFYEEMEEFEIYNGRKSFQEFRDIIFKRFRAFRGEGNLFECSFFLNILENLMLFYRLSEEEILAFYQEAFSNLEQDKFLMLYLHSENFEENLLQIKKERVDEKGNEIWFEMMLRYLNDSPYGKEHPFREIEDMTAHFGRRLRMEERLIKEVLSGHCIVLEAKKYLLEEVVREIKER